MSKRRTSARLGRGQISYQESSGSEKDDDHSTAPSSPVTPSRSTRASRPSRNATTATSDHLLFSPDPLQAAAVSTPFKGRLHSVKHHHNESPRPQRSNKRRRVQASYKELSSSDAEYEEEDDDIVPVQRSRRAHVESSAASPRHRKQSRTRPAVRTKEVSRRGVPDQSLKNAPIESDGAIPDWQNLPYDILLTIFRYAIHPLHDENRRPTSSANWAVKAAVLCKNFAEPVLTALYETPPLNFLDQPHNLLHLLKKDTATFVDYRKKIKYLDLDTKQALAYSAQNLGQFRLGDLTLLLPNLRGIDITDERNRPPFRQHSKRGNWHYPHDLFETMSSTGTQLKWWRHCASMIFNPTRNDMDSIFLEPCFANLTHLTLSQLYLDVEDTWPVPTSLLPTALSSLRALRSLTLEACEIHRTWELLNCLPNELHQLSVIYCTSIDASVLNPFLADHGRQLRRLILNHNNCLDLSFLEDLATSCPKLEVLQTDHTYYSSSHLFQNADAEPRYESLLEPGSIPTWPAALREITMVHMRKWDSDAALGFLESLTDSAAQLQQLRHLTLRCMIDVPWRERAGLRDKWIAKFEKVFLRRLEAPAPQLASFKAYRLWKEREQENREAEEAGSKRKTSNAERRLTRAAEAEAEAESDDDDECPVQGLCEKVDISIDNMRPAEVTFNENDFMDSEQSGDEEYTGVNDEPSSPQGPRRYAWR